jgi:gliding motility-associated-like protein
MKKILFTMLGVLSFMSVKADLADPQDPDTWNVTANSYQYSMTITTALVFDMEESRDINDKIAAFAGSDCRGVAQPITYFPESDRYLAHLLVYSNNVSGDSITLYMYDHSTGDIVEVAKKLAFVSNATYGNADDPYLSRNSYNIQFVIESSESPLQNARVELDGYGTKYTDESGIVTYYDVFPSDSIAYFVSAEGHEDYSNSLSLVDGDIVRTVDMALESYDVAFHLTDGILPVGGLKVELEGYGFKETNVYGKVVFPNVIVEDSIPFTISGYGYYSYEGTINVVGEAITRKVTLTKTAYNLSFEVSDKDAQLSSVSISCVVSDDEKIYDFINNELPDKFKTTGNGLWTVDSGTPFQGEYSIKSGVLHDNQVSKINFDRYSREGTISFFKKVSSEKDNDYLAFKIDGKEKGRWSGESGWEFVSYPIDEGEHSFEWIYSKDGSNVSGEDCAWLDYIVVPSGDSIELNAETDNSGEATFYSMDPEKPIRFSLYSDDHEEYYGYIQGIHSDTSMDIKLSRVYSVNFKVLSGEESGGIEVNDALVKLVDLQKESTSDVFGEAAFERISPNDSIGYSIEAEGYLPVSGSLKLIDADVTETVVLEMEKVLEAANLISPNGDGKNDYWEIFNIERYQEFTVNIYSEAGEKIYSTTDYGNNKWDGKINGNKLPDGIYYYIITSPIGNLVFKGIINLIN